MMIKTNERTHNKKKQIQSNKISKIFQCQQPDFTNESMLNPHKFLRIYDAKLICECVYVISFFERVKPEFWLVSMEKEIILTSKRIFFYRKNASNLYEWKFLTYLRGACIVCSNGKTLIDFNVCWMKRMNKILHRNNRMLHRREKIRIKNSESSWNAMETKCSNCKRTRFK